MRKKIFYYICTALNIDDINDHGNVDDANDDDDNNEDVSHCVSILKCQ